MPPVPDWSTLSPTERAVAQELATHGPLPRVALASRLGLSQTSLSRLTKPLIARGVIVHEPVAHAREQPGRPLQPLSINVGDHRFVGVKITADAAFAVATDLLGLVHERAERPLPDRAPAHVLDAVADLVRRLDPDATATAVGLSLSGTVDRTGVSYNEFLEWHDVPVSDTLGAALRTPIVLENDVVAFTRDIRRRLVPADTPFALLTVGAGIGYGLVLEGRARSGDARGVTSIGHQHLIDAGPVCELGHHGCAVGVLSTPSMLRYASAAAGRELTLDGLLSAIEEPPVSALIGDAAVALGRLLASIANATMVPQLIVTGDGYPLLALLWERAIAVYEQNRDPRSAPASIALSRSDFFDWARGAALAASDQYRGGALGV